MKPAYLVAAVAGLGALYWLTRQGAAEAAGGAVVGAVGGALRGVGNAVAESLPVGAWLSDVVHGDPYATAAQIRADAAAQRAAQEAPAQPAAPGAYGTFNDWLGGLLWGNPQPVTAAQIRADAARGALEPGSAAMPTYQPAEMAIYGD